MYASALVLLIGTIAGMFYYMYNWYSFATADAKVDQVGVTFMDRVVRDIRSGTDIDFAKSSFNTNNGEIFINAKENSVAVTKDFILNNGVIIYKKDGGVAQNITPSSVFIKRLYFTSITASTTSKSVKIDLDIEFKTKTGSSTRSYGGLSILRQSYDM